jgi:MEDS: MEthanogen/methylotroph, DcmR Sensory domain
VLSREVKRELDGMPPGTHAVLVYDSQERKEDALLTHLKLGNRYDALVYACSEESPAQAEASMKAFGIDVDGRKADDSILVKNYDEVYIRDGTAAPQEIIKGFSDLAYGYSFRGYGMRASAEMSCFFDHHLTSQLLTYESDLHRKFSFPAIGFCGYNLVKMYNSGDLDVLWPILRAHALVVMTGPNGSFALPPEDVGKKLVEDTMGIPDGSVPSL